MRTRDSNKQKRFRPSDILPDLGSSEDEAEEQDETGGPMEEDDVFVADPTNEPADEEDLIMEEAPGAMSDGVEELGNAASKRISRLKPRERQARKGFGEVQPYPVDPAAKWTRAYIGPVQRWTRLA